MHSAGVPFNHAHQLRLAAEISTRGYADSYGILAKFFDSIRRSEPVW
jgi:hypothetical protein